METKYSFVGTPCHRLDFVDGLDPDVILLYQVKTLDTFVIMNYKTPVVKWILWEMIIAQKSCHF